MDTDSVKKLIKILEESGLESLTYKSNDVEISLSKGHAAHAAPIHAVLPQAQQVAPVITPENGKNTVKSPLVGIFYGRPSPEQESFVQPGTKVKAGDVLCIIEAMKVMNEIKANTSGVIQEVLVEDGEMVEFEQPLFTII